MNPHLSSLPFIDPASGAPLTLADAPAGQEQWFTDAAGRRAYPLRNGIPRFVGGTTAEQEQTTESFGFKWNKTDSYGSVGMQQMTIAWYLTKYGFASLTDWATRYQGKRVLDVGCGSAFSAKLWLDAVTWNAGSLYVGADISSAIDVAQGRLAHLPHVALVQADALRLPFADGSFDFLFSEGVLHHTPSTSQALLASARKLRPGGEYHFYVYKRKAPMREWADDYVRERLAGLSDAAAWDEMRSLTRLGKALADTKAEITLPEAIPLLGLPAGTFNLQRFFYNHFAKAFWNDTMSFEENVHINFDWYRPAYAHRQSPEEVRAWCSEAGLAVDYMHVDDSGITVKATRR